jgi:hypothetical protein
MGGGTESGDLAALDEEVLEPRYPGGFGVGRVLGTREKGTLSLRLCPSRARALSPKLFAGHKETLFLGKLVRNQDVGCGEKRNI